MFIHVLSAVGLCKESNKRLKIFVSRRVIHACLFIKIVSDALVIFQDISRSIKNMRCSRRAIHACLYLRFDYETFDNSPCTVATPPPQISRIFIFVLSCFFIKLINIVREYTKFHRHILIMGLRSPRFGGGLGFFKTRVAILSEGCLR